jgi:ArsR family transcriptional regulator
MIQTNESLKKAAEIIRALGHPARIEILTLLRNKSNKKMTVSQIQEELKLTQPETSRHLAVLKNSSVLRNKKEGSNTYYFINDEHSIVRCIANCLIKNEDK